MSQQQPIEIPKEMGHDSFEFTSNQNEVIEELGNSLKWVSLPFMVLGTLTIFNFIMFLMVSTQIGMLSSWNTLAVGLLMIMQFLFFLLMGRYTTTASVGFLAITRTKGKDISFLMIALNNLRAIFSVLAFAVKLFLILSVISLIMSLVHYYRSGPAVPANPQPSKAVVKDAGTNKG
ncbi:MAG: hypothetical protein U0796_23255 [Gemmatales bacterium]